MNINKDNCLAYFLDYHEGNLSPAEKQEVESFLVLNPELRERFEAFDANINVPIDNIVFKDRDALKRTSEGVSPYNHEIIAYLEGDLNHASEKAFLKKVESTSTLKEDLRLFKLSKLPAEAIVFANKESLKKRTIIRRLAPYASLAAAACLTLLIGYYYIQAPNKGDLHVIASSEKTEKKRIEQKTTATSTVNAEPKETLIVTHAVKRLLRKKEIINPLPILSKKSLPTIDLSEPTLVSIAIPQVTFPALAKVDEQAEKQASTSTSFTEFAGRYIQKRITDKDFNEIIQKKDSRGFFAYAVNKLASITGGNFGVKTKTDSLKQEKNIILFAGNIEYSRTSRK